MTQKQNELCLYKNILSESNISRLTSRHILTLPHMIVCTHFYVCHGTGACLIFHSMQIVKVFLQKTKKMNVKSIVLANLVASRLSVHYFPSGLPRNERSREMNVPTSTFTPPLPRSACGGSCLLKESLFYRRGFSKEDRLTHNDESIIPRRNKCLQHCRKLFPFRQSRSKMKDAVRDDGRDYKFNKSGSSSVIGRCSPTVQLKTSFCAHSVNFE